MVCFFPTSVANETENLNFWSKLNQWVKIPQLTQWKVSVAGTSLKESDKKVYESLCEKNNSQLKKAKIVSSEHILSVTGHRGINFLNDYDEADEEELRWLLQ